MPFIPAVPLKAGQGIQAKANKMMVSLIKITLLRFFLVLSSAGIIAPCWASDPPNILFILSDDQAYNTIHVLGNDQIQTPNLDKLVEEGVTFTRAYNMGAYSSPVCVSSRAMLNTGQTLWRAQRLDLKIEQKRGRIWSQYLKKAGYKTYFTGKWHLNIPAKDVFDIVRHVRGGMPQITPEAYNRPLHGQPDIWKPWDRSFGGYWKGGKHWSEVLADDAINFLRDASQSNQPFFMYLAFNAPHDPRQSPKKYIDLYKTKRIPLPQNFLPYYPLEYYAIISHMDEQIGRILNALRKSRKYQNTYIFFSSDNGLSIGSHGFMTKQSMYEHALRCPLIINGPGIPADKRVDNLVYIQDIMATTLDLAGIAKPKHIEFDSLLNLIRSKTHSESRKAIYGAYKEFSRAIIKRDYKMILYPKILKIRLFDLKKDPYEMKNLAGKSEYKNIITELLYELSELQMRLDDNLDLKKSYPMYFKSSR
jgi:choline-sulfatase